MKKIVRKKTRFKNAHIVGTIIIQLTILEVTLSNLKLIFADDKNVLFHLGKIEFWMNKCWETVGWKKRKSLSTSLMKRVDQETSMVDACRKSILGKDASMEAWTTWLICIDGFINDTISLWEQGNTLCWRCLSRVWDNLVRLFMFNCKNLDKAEVNGSDLFLKIMETTNWHTEEL